MKLFTPWFHFSVICGMTSPYEVKSCVLLSAMVLPSGPVNDSAAEAAFRPATPIRLKEACPPRTGVAKM